MNKKKDLTQFCRETNETHQSVSESDFRSAWCRRCRNQECRFSQWGEGLWINRMETQVDRLLDNPLFGDPRQEQFRHLQDILFEDMKHQAVPIHIGNMNEDWSVPSEEQVASFMKGEHLATQEADPYGKNTLSEEKEEEWTDGQTLSKTLEEKPSEVSSQVENAQPFVTNSPTLPPSMNTPSDDMGIMIGGGDPIVEEKPPVVIDDWSVPPTVKNIVPIGGKIVMGGHKGDKK